ncbi:MAG: DUF454 domain-containing protein [Phyllobacteriaceae bacterium]|jgi:uncharacterized membrane protein YbaN (DUF454 family)|nr:DUF454 domain-containing protein [Phyllobacteriaceae bacterium]
MKRLKRLAKPFYLAIGWVSVLLGAIGVIIPILPTTPFLIVAVWAFSRSSPAFAERIRNHPLVGPYIRDWQDFGVIPTKAKVLACTMMGGASLYLMTWSPAPLWLAIGAVAAMGLVAIYVLSRPSRRAGP